MAGSKHGSFWFSIYPRVALLATVISLSPFVRAILSATTANIYEISDHSPPTIQSVEEKEDRLTFTCQGRCGLGYDMPCSCNALCLVYDTCCENFTQDCPNDASQGRDELVFYIGAHIVCDKIGFFKIMSCPTGDKSLKETRSSPTDFSIDKVEADVYYMTSNRSTLQLSTSELERAVTNAPVTDSDSGITFLNMVVYNCYTSLGLTSQPLHWGLNLPDFEADKYQVGDLITVSSHDLYFPTFSTNHIKFWNHKCAMEIIDSCDNTNSSNLTESKREYYASKCKDFAGYVVPKGTGRKFYRNKFCAFCYEVYSLRFKTISLAGRDLSFTTLMSLRQDGTVKFETKSVQAGKWTTTVCPALNSLFQKAGDNDSEQQVTGDVAGTERCHTECIRDGSFYVRSDGLCKINQYAKIAFSHDDLPPLPCWSAVERAARFITCVLDLSYTGNENVDFSPPEVSVVRDSRTEKMLYVADLAFASPIGPREDTNYENWIFNDIGKLSSAIKAFKAYRYSHNLCLSNHGQTTPQHILDYWLSDVMDTVNTWDLALLNKDLVDAVLEEQGEVADRHNTTTVCATEVTRSPDMQYLTLRCLEDAMYENDEIQVMKSLNSTCVSLLEEVDVLSSRSSGTMVDAQRIVSFYYVYVAVHWISQMVTGKRRVEER